MMRVFTIGWWLHVAYYYLFLLLFLVGPLLVAQAWLADDIGWVGAAAIGVPITVGLVYVWLRGLAKQTVSERIFVNRPPAEVFAFVARDYFRNRPKWDSDSPGKQVEIEQTSTGPMGAGTTGRYVVREDDHASEWHYQVDAYVPERVMSLTGTSTAGGWKTIQTLAFEPIGTGTGIRLKQTIEMPLRRGILGPIYAPQWRESYRQGAEKMAKVVERELETAGGYA